MKFKTKLIAVLVACGISVFALSAPAQAINGNNTLYCNWPKKATIQFTTWSKGQVIVYSPSGYYLGSRALNVPGNTTYYTPWEDVRFSFSGSIARWSAWCR